MIRNTFIILLFHLTLFSCSNSSTERESLYSFILPIALNDFFSGDLDGKHFVLDTTGVGSLIEYSFDPLLFGEDLISSMKKYESEHEFNNGRDWIKDFQSEPFIINYAVRDETSGVLSITDPIVTEKNEILVYIELHCGNDCGGGGLFLIDSKNSKFEIIDKQWIWG